MPLLDSQSFFASKLDFMSTPVINTPATPAAAALATTAGRSRLNWLLQALKPMSTAIGPLVVATAAIPASATKMVFPVLCCSCSLPWSDKKRLSGTEPREEGADRSLGAYFLGCLM